jgi:hypothetical protein
MLWVGSVTVAIVNVREEEPSRKGDALLQVSPLSSALESAIMLPVLGSLS